MHCRHLLIPLLMSLSVPVNAVVPGLPTRDQVDRWLAPLGADRSFDTSEAIDWGVIPGPFYTPELGIGIGVAMAGLYRPDSQDQTSQNSTITLSGYVSSTGAIGLRFTNHSFLAGDRWRFFLPGMLSHTPTYYWGRGFRAGSDRRNQQQYLSEEIRFTPRLLRRIAPCTYLGVGWSLDNMQASGFADRQKTGPEQEPDGAAVFSSGPLLSLSYDSRDYLSDPRRGVNASLQYIRYSKPTGSNTRFDSGTVHFSAYHSLDDQRVVAWEVNTVLTQGQVSWNMLPSLGSSDHFRGYYPGRFRDRDILTTQLEYRQSLSWRHGVVGWIGGGTLASAISRLGSERWLPTLGAGYRFAFKPGMNIRLDYGVGKGSRAFYFQVGEAF